MIVAALVGVGVFVGAAVITGVADGVAESAIWAPDGKIEKDRETFREIPKLSTVSIVIVCWRTARDAAGLNDQIPFESVKTTALIGSDWIVIFTDLFGTAVPVNLGLLSMSDSDALGEVILISPLFPTGGIFNCAARVASSLIVTSVKS